MAIHETNAENFDSLVAEGFVIVDFFSETCVPCKMFSRILEELADDVPFVEIVKGNTTKYPELAERFSISAVPTVMFYKDGICLERRQGVQSRKELEKVISEHMYDM